MIAQYLAGFIPPAPQMLAPRADLTVADVILFVNEPGGARTFGDRVVDFFGAIIPGFHGINEPMLNESSWFTQQEAINVQNTVDRRFIFDLFWRFRSERGVSRQPTVLARAHTAEIILTAASFDSFQDAMIFPGLIHALTRVDNSYCKDIMARDVVFWNGDKAMELRSSYSLAVRQCALKLPFFQEWFDYNITITNNTIEHFVQVMLFRDIVRLMRTPVTTMKPVFRVRGHSRTTRRFAPASRLA